MYCSICIAALLNMIRIYKENVYDIHSPPHIYDFDPFL